MEELHWKSDYNIGVQVIDAAHKQLFGVLRRILNLLAQDDSEKNKWACVEAIKFLEGYTLRHFREEEAYQLSIGYADYKLHKSLHDNLRDVTLPAVKEGLERDNYSKEAIEYFVGVFTGWLTGHVMIEDQAIVGKVESLWKPNDIKAEIELLHKECSIFMASIFNIRPVLIHRHYGGEQLKEAIFFGMRFELASGSCYEIILCTERAVVLMMAGGMLGEKAFTMDKAALVSFMQIGQSIAQKIVHMIEPDVAFKLSSKRNIQHYQLQNQFAQRMPDISVLWQLPDGKFGICIEKIVKDV